MSHFGDFMDGVPVKISEKYKRPLRYDLPYSVQECTGRAQNVVDSANYSCTFEKNVLVKLKELRNAKETKKNERRHRLQLLQEAEQKRLDAIAAAEDEERLKQLSVSEVSYPSTDEFSALSPDDKPDKTCDNTNNVDNTEIAHISNNTAYPSTSINAESQLNILQPIQVQSNVYPENSLLDDPDPLQNLKMSTKITKMAHNPNLETLTYRDFENDNSSPFDNIELKTINDMELLAQVLQPNKDSVTSCGPPVGYVQDCDTQAQMENMTYLPSTYIDHSAQASNIIYNSPQHYPMSNGYYIPTEAEGVNMYVPNYQYYVPQHPYTTVDPYYNQLPTTSADINAAQNGFIPHPYYFHYPSVPVPYQPADNNVTPYGTPVQNDTVNPSNTEPQESQKPKSKSRSVPDIVRELNEELEKLRMCERSYNASPAPKAVTLETPKSSNERKREKHKRKTEHLANPFDKLSPQLQDMCRKIHGMGFPIDRVARVCTLLGDNDKRVIEGLLILGEVMDLGFSESKACAALAKHEFNRDKALDELVS